MSSWIDAHDASLKNHVASGRLTFSGMAAAINSEFNTAYSRNACIGRASRLGYGTVKPIREPKMKSPGRQGAGPMMQKINRARHTQKSAFEVHPLADLRVVNLAPRATNITITDLEPGECRWPVSEIDGIHHFCGHPGATEIDISGRTITYSYCSHHRAHSIGNGTTSERMATRGIAA